MFTIFNSFWNFLCRKVFEEGRRVKLMRGIIILSIFTFISCQHNHPEKKYNLKEDIIQYYKCDYELEDGNIVVLSSGGYNEASTEYWAINVLEIEKKNNARNIDVEVLISNAKKHLLKRFTPIDLIFSDISIQDIGALDGKSQVFIGIVSFEYREDMFQKVPVLLDGTIVLSNKE